MRELNFGARFVMPWATAAALTLAAVLASTLVGCASWSSYDPPNVELVGMDPLPSEGIEMRFALRIRVQNPNDTPIEYDGIALGLDLNGRSFATGVSDAHGSIPRFGEAIVTLPITISAFSLVRQAFGLAALEQTDGLPYELSGKLGGGFMPVRFHDEGIIDLPEPPASQPTPPE